MGVVKVLLGLFFLVLGTLSAMQVLGPHLFYGAYYGNFNPAPALILILSIVNLIVLAFYRFKSRNLMGWGLFVALFVFILNFLLILGGPRYPLLSLIFGFTVMLLPLMPAVIPLLAAIDYLYLFPNTNTGVPVPRTSRFKRLLVIGASLAVIILAFLTVQSTIAMLNGLRGSTFGITPIEITPLPWGSGDYRTSPPTTVGLSIFLRPASQQYGGPSSALKDKVDAVVAWFAKQGIAIPPSGVRSSIFLSATPSQLSNAFHLEIQPCMPRDLPVPPELSFAVKSISVDPCVPLPQPAKPVIYLYPTHPEPVSVTLDYIGTITDAYPSFNNGTTWGITAYPDGHIIDSKDGREYSYLFWEGKDEHQYDLSTGFVVNGSDTAAFLQRQLAAMGLMPKEYNEFIVYWLPKLQHNPYNLIHFAGNEYVNIAKLNITPAPDSILRIFMIYRPLSAPVFVAPQSLPSFSRKGFTVIEWGGTEL